MAEQLFTFSFIDMGNEDFVRDDEGIVVKKKLASYEDASGFVADGGLDEFDWSNKGTRNWCWEAEKDGVDVP